MALLRGVNVGGRKLAMADLRAIVEALGHIDVKTYIQSGNVLFTPSDSGDGDSAALASALGAAIEERLAMAVGVVVLTREELAAALEADPYASEPDPRYVHLIFFASALDEAARERVAAAQEAVAARGSRDTATILGRTLY
ncbi:MAG: DUF1697 domain-containing protein, partial [Candidatus Dormibacteraceae bacterium]